MTEPNNTLAQATNIGRVLDPRTVSDFVGTFDTNDFFSFNLGSRSSFNLSLTGLSADADVQLLTNTGALIASSAAGGSTSEFINRQLNAGDYAIRVFQFSGDTFYNLNVSASPFDFAGNSIATARDIGPVGVQSFFQDAVTSSDTNDFYRLQINPNSSLSVRLDNLAADADLQVLNSAGTVIATSAAGGTTADAINLSAAQVRAAGSTLFVRVYQFSGNTAYNLTLNGSLPDLAGNTTGAARNIGNLNGSQNFVDFVNSGDTNDFYQFTVGPNSNLTARIDTLDADADLQILNAAGTVIGSSSFGGTTPDQVNLNNLAGGVYFARVLQFSGDSSYNLTLSATQPDFAGNTIGTALNFGTLNGTRVFNDEVRPGDVDDFYRFSLTGSSTVNIGLNGLTADADLQLLNSAGGFIAGSAAIGTTAESVIRTLGAGTYFVRVNSFAGASTLYNLSLSSTLVPTTDQAGNSTGTARNIGPVGVQSSFRDRVSSTDPFDFYRLQINPNSSLSLTLNGLSADADLSLLNAAGTVIRSSANGGTLADSISLTAAEVRANGTTYFVRVNSFAGANTAYNLTLNGSLPDVAGNSTGTARNLGNLNGSQTFIDFVTAGDPNDFYRFTVGPNSNLSVRLDNLAADADIEILNAAGVVIGSSRLGGTAADQVNLNGLAGGLYFARVLRFGGDTSYRLNLSATQPDFAGNSFGTALNFGELNGRRIFNDDVRGTGSTTDTHDFYRFNLSHDGTFTANLGHLTADADLSLFNSSGTLIASSSAGGTTSEFISRALAAGTYYVEVSSFAGANTLYNLNLAAV